MKLEIELKNGNKQVIEDVENYTVIDDETAKISPPTEGEVFEVDLSRIKRELFRLPRKDDEQEGTRQLIIEAFSKVDSTTQKFQVYVPKRTWKGRREPSWLQSYAKQFGGRVATWLEWALVLAQRISNGESWENICNDFDTAKNHWMVWVETNERFGYDVFYRVGGEIGRYGYTPYAPSHIHYRISDYNVIGGEEATVPLIRLND